MKVTLNDIGKKFNKEWIFNHFEGEFNLNDKTVVLGSNGSGKSTFLKLISGFLIPNNGQINYEVGGETIESEYIYKQISYASPYIGLYEDYTIAELFRFYKSLKSMSHNISEKEFIKIIELTHAKNKEIKYFSSGMKQRVKLGLAILSDTQILLLDEPTVNLDHNAIDWYQSLVKNNIKDRITFVASNNQKSEFDFCDKKIIIEDYK